MRLAAEPILARPPSSLIGGDVLETKGHHVVSHHPARPGDLVWAGDPNLEHMDKAVEAARRAQREWARWPEDKRVRALHRVKAALQDRVEDFARLIALETGKALWDARTEAKALASKVDISTDKGAHSGLARVQGYDLRLGDHKRGACSFRPHGVMAVIGPFNFPAHLPNGHIAPALVAGNAVVFKPSDKTPAVGQLLAEVYIEALDEAGAPRGLVNLVQGHAEHARRLILSDGVDGILFTGSWPVGRKILEANLDTPGRIVALEMGGNNAAVVMDDCDLAQAVVECARCAFITTGQRCTATRRIIVQKGVADRFIDALVKCARSLTIGDPLADDQPFMGPLIRDEAREGVLGFVERAVEMGAEQVAQAHAHEVMGCEGGHFVRPGVLRVDRFTRSEEGPGCDIEVFGPVARVSVVDDFEQALEQCNATRYGLAASVFSKDKKTIDAFLAGARAGCVNVNTGTAGASSKLPFGGLGHSGNHRPAAAFAHDYCAYPVASMVVEGGAKTIPTGMTFEDAWVR